MPLSGGDVAQELVRIEMMVASKAIEFTLRLAGKAAEKTAVFIVAALNNRTKNQTMGKANLKTMIRSGSDLQVYEIQNKHLKAFQKAAKKYGILFCTVKDHRNKGANGVSDILFKQEDAAKLKHVIEKYHLQPACEGSIEQKEIAKSESELSPAAIIKKAVRKTTEFTKTAAERVSVKAILAQFRKEDKQTGKGLERGDKAPVKAPIPKVPKKQDMPQV